MTIRSLSPNEENIDEKQNNSLGQTPMLLSDFRSSGAQLRTGTVVAPVNPLVTLKAG